MISALSNVGGSLHFLRGRNGRIIERHQRVSTNEDDVDHDQVQERPGSNTIVDLSEQDEGAFVGTRQSDVEEGRASASASGNATSRVALAGSENNASILLENIGDEVDDDDENGEVEETDGLRRFTVSAQRATMTLAELEEERELARRRSSACVLFALFVLFRLWIAALQEGDFGLLLLCLIGTSWTARWIRYNREQEEELDRRIASYIQNSDGNNTNGGTALVNRNDLRLLSFQAQLALAIMESQRQMMEGGYGHPDGNSSQTLGVSEDAKTKWEAFLYKSEKHRNIMAKGFYGSVSPDDDDEDLKKPSSKLNEEEPHCSICLGEYEDDEKLLKLPCEHVYHDECINSWCSNHTRCPLCNYDLNQEKQEDSSTQRTGLV